MTKWLGKKINLVGPQMVKESEIEKIIRRLQCQLNYEIINILTGNGE